MKIEEIRLLLEKQIDEMDLMLEEAVDQFFVNLEANEDAKLALTRIYADYYESQASMLLRHRDKLLGENKILN